MSDRLELVLAYTPDGEVPILWRVPEQDWKLRPAPPDFAADLRRLRAWLTGETEIVAEPSGPEADLLAPVPELIGLEGETYPTAKIVGAGVRIELGEP